MYSIFKELLYSDSGNSRTAQKISMSKVYKLVLPGALCIFFFFGCLFKFVHHECHQSFQITQFCSHYRFLSCFIHSFSVSRYNLFL